MGADGSAVQRSNGASNLVTQLRYHPINLTWSLARSDISDIQLVVLQDPRLDFQRYIRIAGVLGRSVSDLLAIRKEILKTLRLSMLCGNRRRNLYEARADSLRSIPNASVENALRDARADRPFRHVLKAAVRNSQVRRKNSSASGYTV
jgi:hypothetical protein